MNVAKTPIFILALLVVIAQLGRRCAGKAIAWLDSLAAAVSAFTAALSGG
jgi:hypothetical protein